MNPRPGPLWPALAGSGIVLLLLAVLCAGLAARVVPAVSRTHPALEAPREQAALITAAELHAAYRQDEKTADAKYLGKALLVRAVVAESFTDPGRAQYLVLLVRPGRPELPGVLALLRGRKDGALVELPPAGKTILVFGHCGGGWEHEDTRNPEKYASPPQLVILDNCVLVRP